MAGRALQAAGDCPAHRALPADSLPILAIKEDGTVQFNSPEQAMSPKPGHVIIWFGPKAEKPAPARAETSEAVEKMED